MKFNFIFVLAVIILAGYQPLTSAQSLDCSVDEEAGICQEGECRLEDGEIGLCQGSSDNCVCVPVN